MAGSQSTRQFLYDGDQLSQEYDGAGNLLRRYVHGDGEDDPQVWYEGAGTASPRYLYTDHQVSVVGIADAAGNLVNANSYDEYGIPAASNAGRFGYTGQAWLPELGMWHYKARIYSPMLGRFLQTDPIGYADQNNLYAYVGNDPVDGRDPSGRLGCGTGGRQFICPLQVKGGPVNGSDTKASQMTPASDPRAGAIRARDGGYYTGDPNNPTWHSDAVDAAIQGGTLALGVLGDEAIGRALAGLRTLSMAAEGVAAAIDSSVGVGEYAGESIAARSAGRGLTTAECAEINRISSETGCHACGTFDSGSKLGNFVPDHQPPSALNPFGEPQQLYPQCLACSRQQGLDIIRILRGGN